MRKDRNQPKIVINKELQAFCANAKQDRMLRISLQTLDLERGFALKILQLDFMQARLNQRRLRERVKKISTHLSFEEIANMKSMDAEIEFEFGGIRVSSSVTLAAASKRLKLNSSYSKPAKDTMQQATPRRIKTPPKLSRLESGLSVRLNESGKATVRTGHKTAAVRPYSSVERPLQSTTVIRPLTAPRSKLNKDVNRRPATASAAFSSHERQHQQPAATVDQSESSPPSSQPARRHATVNKTIRRVSCTSDDSVEMASILRKRQDARNNYLEYERSSNAAWSPKKAAFLDRIRTLVIENKRFYTHGETTNSAGGGAEPGEDAT